MITLDRQLQVLVDTHTIESLYVFRGIRTIELVDHPADTDVRTHLQCSSHVDVLITTTTPVVVLHLSAMHLHHTTTSMYHEAGICHSVVEGHEERSHLEH